jgi:hypothetical protein
MTDETPSLRPPEESGHWPSYLSGFCVECRAKVHLVETVDPNCVAAASLEKSLLPKRVIRST